MAFTVDSSLNQAKMYINGVEQGSSDSFDTHLCANNDCTGGTFTIGASPWWRNGINPYKDDRFFGGITEVRFWDKVLSPDQIDELKDYRLADLECGTYIQGEACTAVQADACSDFARCEVMDGSPSCNCFEGYIEDGDNCVLPPSPMCVSPRTERISNLRAYWPLASDFDDKSGMGYDLWTPRQGHKYDGNGGDPTPPVLVAATSADPFPDGYTRFDDHAINADNQHVPILLVEDFDPKGDGDGSYTVEFWYRVHEESEDGSYMATFAQKTGEAMARFVLRDDRQGANGRACEGGADTTLKVVAGENDYCGADPTRWHHLAFTFDISAEEAKIYIDGELLGLEEDYNTPLCGNNTCSNGGVLALGAYLEGEYENLVTDSHKHLVGAMTEARVWNKALSEA